MIATVATMFRSMNCRLIIRSFHNVVVLRALLCASCNANVSASRSLSSVDIDEDEARSSSSMRGRLSSVIGDITECVSVTGVIDVQATSRGKRGI